MIDYSTLDASWLAAAGIAWDISGAVALSLGVFFVSDEKLKRQAGSYWGANPAAMRAFCEQRLDTRFGLAQLIVGFAMQALASVGLTTGPVSAGIIAAGVVPAWWFYRHNLLYWLVRDTLRLGVGQGSKECVWRSHFDDVPDRIWNAVLWNEGIAFERD